MANIFGWFKISSCTRRFGQSRHGHAGIMFSVLALPLILAVGFVIDFTQATRYRSELQNVADAVALSAVRGLPISELQGLNDGKNLYESMMSSIRAGLVSDNITITFETDPDYIAKVVINATVKGLFGGSVALGPITFEIDARAVLGGNDTEVAMVVDLSASMVTARMRALGNAMSTFDTAIQETAQALDRLRIAVIPFAQTVTLPDYASSWLGDPAQVLLASATRRTCFEAVNSTQDISIAPPSAKSMTLLKNYARCMPETTFPLTTSFAEYRAMANAFKNPPSWRATWKGQETGPYWGTSIYLGATWANRLLSPDWAPFLPAGSAPRSPNKAAKFAIIMTDGAQDQIISYTRAQADVMLLNTCNSMRANGISVFTIGFSVTAASQTLLKRCADSDANFINAGDEAQLRAAFERVGRLIGQATARLIY